MAPQPIHILPRAGGASSPSGVYIAGFVVAGVVLLGGVGWLTLRFLRKRAQRKDGDKRGAAFLNVRGLVREDDEKDGNEPLPKYGYQFYAFSAYRRNFDPYFSFSDCSDIHNIQSHMFSRAHLGTEGVVMPSRVLTRPNVTKQEIVDYHASEGNLPRPFAPFSFALQAGTTPTVGKRNSTASVLTVSRDSFLSMNSQIGRAHV